MTSPADAEKAVCYTHSSSKCLPQLLCLWSMEKLMRSTQVWIQSGRQDLRTHIVLLRRMEGRGKRRSLGESFPFWPLHPSKPGVCRIDLGQVNIFPTLWQHCFVYKDMEVWGAASCWKLLAKCLWMWVWTWLRSKGFLESWAFSLRSAAAHRLSSGWELTSFEVDLHCSPPSEPLSLVFLAFRHPVLSFFQLWFLLHLSILSWPWHSWCPGIRNSSKLTWQA